MPRNYYRETAKRYDALHLGADPEHDAALSWLIGLVEAYSIQFVLDVGAGTGRTVQYLKRQQPRLHVIGLEPVQELREIGFKKGLLESELVAGEGANIPFGENEFDLTCAFAVLHHVKRPQEVIREMLRCSAKGIFISDSNNFGQGGAAVRFLKRLARRTRTWPIINWINTKGRGYHSSPEDGISYSYSVFDSIPEIRKSCRSVYFLGTSDSDGNLLNSASHVAVLGLK